MKHYFTKTPHGLVPDTPDSKEWFDKVKLGEGVSGEFKKVRSYRFHKKLFALLQLGFEYFEPPEIETEWGKPQKSFDIFRKNVTVLAGFYEVVYSIDGTFRLEAKSISFASMDETEFEKLYQKTLTILMDKVLSEKGFTREDAIKTADKFLTFA